MRALRCLAGLFVLIWSFLLAGYVSFASWLAGPVAVLGLSGLLVVVAAWLPLSDQAQRRVGWAAVLAVVAALRRSCSPR